MEQLELFGKDELQPVSVWLRAWLEANGAGIKNPASGRLATMQGKPAEAGEGGFAESGAAE